MSRYHFQPIDTARGEIRLLTILPGDTASAIECRLDTVQLTHSIVPDFEALSYTWGSTTDLVPLYFSQSSADYIEVTPNLFQCLPYLRQQNDPRVLWIDAVCINQKNLAERSEQVNRIAEVYSKARRVVVWLGPANEASRLAMATLEALAESVTVDWEGHGSMKSRSSHPKDAHWGDQHQPLPYDIKTWHAIQHLLSRSWFERLWIWQEIRLANSSAIILCGKNTMLWKQFSNAMYCIRYKRQDTGVPGLSKLIDRAYEIVDFYGYASLKTMMYQTRYAKCLDDRDRIYGLLGILHNSIDADLAIEPDYTKSTKDVYKELVLRYIEKQQRLNILLLCEMKILNSSISLPSWVPNFTVPNKTRPILNMRAAGDSLCEVSIVGDVLTATGIAVSTICTAKPFNLIPTTYPYQTVVEATRAFGNNQDLDALCRGRCSMSEAYCRTMCAGRTSDRYVPTHESLPDISTAMTVLQAIFDFDGALPDISPAAKLFLDYAQDTCNGRAFIATASGHIGVGPEAAQDGDMICVLLGCDSPLLLRSTTGGTQYLLVGECYIHELMCNESILGSLPKGISRVSRFDSSSGKYFGAYVNSTTGEFTIEDPRLGDLPKAWKRKVHNLQQVKSIFVHESGVEATEDVDPRLSKSVLEEKGVCFEYFQLF